jgi:hypothetical protein
MFKAPRKQAVTLEQLRSLFTSFDTLACRVRYKQQKQFVPYATTTLVRNWDNVNTVTIVFNKSHHVMTHDGLEVRDGATFILKHE